MSIITPFDKPLNVFDGFDEDEICQEAVAVLRKWGVKQIDYRAGRRHIDLIGNRPGMKVVTRVVPVMTTNRRINGKR